MNIKLLNNESVWHKLWPQNKYRLAWLIFHSTVALPYISKTIWWMNTILFYNESVWLNLWPQNKYRSTWPMFHTWMSCIRIISQCDVTFDPIIDLGHNDYISCPVILFYILESVSWMNVILRDNESVWCTIWPFNKYRSQWPIFHGLVILPNILKSLWLLNVILWDNECNLMIDLIDVGHSDPYFWSNDFASLCFIEVLLCLPPFLCMQRAMLSCDTAYFLLSTF